MTCFWTYSYFQMFKFCTSHYFHIKMYHNFILNVLKSLLSCTSPRHQSIMITIKIKARFLFITISMMDNISYCYLHDISVYRMLSDTIICPWCILLLCPFCRWENQGSERWSSLQESTQRGSIWDMALFSLLALVTIQPCIIALLGDFGVLSS